MSKDLNPSCPSGGQYYACTTGSLFVGCCTGGDPCSQTGCAAGNLRPLSFNKDAHGLFPDQNCPAGGSQWYTCAANSPPFMGCCKTNPCGSVCRQSDLVGGVLNSANHIGYTNDTSKSTSTASSNANETPGKQSISSGAIAGIVIGAVLGLALLAGAIWWFCRRQRKSRQSAESSENKASSQPLVNSVDGYGRSPGATPSFGKPSPGGTHPAYRDSPSNMQTPPPTYSQPYAELGEHAAIVEAPGSSAMIQEAPDTPSKSARGQGLGLQVGTGGRHRPQSSIPMELPA